VPIEVWKLTIDDLLRASEVNGLDTTGLLAGRASSGLGSLDGGSPHKVGGSDESASLDGRRRHLASQWGAESLGEAS